ncbi:holo-acyl-carrier-protein synthase [Oscillochloris trichoides DG-6]|uniref:Holo-[acyl-carrier-protein] synthase n=1 Tax=Oscillochloris trichoides DG-6 TaxID=765420 RepID=E1IG82_9CHLR|nr:holo-ACP synthase [Oscillochloris trichoides]EFO79816.1 holo-acyl-carrier-protein synthase [Oscillochloris trichoides DG-6]
MIYHGVDLIEIRRIRRATERWGERFLRRVFTSAELHDCAALGPQPSYQSLAGRWAAKEAAAKALGIGLSGMSAAASLNERPGMTDIEVVRESDGRPSLRLHGPAAARATQLGLTSIALSISHSGEYALASVVALATSLPPITPSSPTSQ